MSKLAAGYDLSRLDDLDVEHQRLAANRLHFLEFTRTLSDKKCKCSDGKPVFVLSEGPTQGEQRKVECGICHTYLAWLPKAKNKDARKTSSTNLATVAYCQLCRKVGVSLVGHHVIEVQEGGSNDPSNIWTVCEPCHVIIHALRRRVGHDDPS